MKTISLAVFTVFSLLTAGCAVDRSDPNAVAEASFHAIMAKDYQALGQLVELGGNIPSIRAWNDASFVRDDTSDGGIRERWSKGPIGGYTQSEVVLEDWQGISVRPDRLVQVHFFLAGKSYIATFSITRFGDKWSPGPSPSTSDFVIRFEER